MNDNHPQNSAPAQDANTLALKILNERLWHFTSAGINGAGTDWPISYGGKKVAEAFFK